jgi:trehalose synthase
MRITDTSDLWWKTAVLYCLDVETFLDWDGDGCGDFVGLAQRIDYLAELGITCLWLMPFYPTPDKDDGYDITNHYGVDSRLGNHGDVVEVIRTANDRGIRVIADLVVNHTSDRHPWFRASRSDPDSPYRDWYVWRDEPTDDPTVEPVFPDQERGVWSYDDKAGQYYLHRFYRHQPDLNVENPAVRDEIAKVMGFWLQMGLAGFRVDAVPFFLETFGVDRPEGAPDPHSYLRDLRAFLQRRTGDGILLGEVNLPYEEQFEYFGGDAGDQLTMQFDFVLMQKLYLAMARTDTGPIIEALGARPQLPAQCQWANFVRNHDELTLDKLTDDERQEVFDAFGSEPEMQLYGRGLRRRLPTMLDGDPRRIRMVYSLLFSLPGTPVLLYGEEIGMGENLAAEGRHAVRSPMQWTAEANGGYSTARPSKLAAPVVDGGYGPPHLNVQQQRNDPDSLLNFVKQLVQRYRECPELGWGSVEIVDQEHRDVLVHVCSWDTAHLVAMHNLAPEARTVRLRLAFGDGHDRLVDLFQDEVTTIEDGRVELLLEAYGHRWLRVANPGDRRLL